MAAFGESLLAARRQRRPRLALWLLATAVAALRGLALPAWLLPSALAGGSPRAMRGPASVPSSERGAAVIRRGGNIAQVPGDIKNGLKILIDGAPCLVESFISKKVGKGIAVTKAKVVNLLNGATVDKTLQSGQKYEVVDTMWRDATYSYFNEDTRVYNFMDAETFDEIEIPEGVIGKAADWLSDGQLVDVESYEGQFLTFRFKGDITAEVTSIEERGRNDGQNMITLANGLTQAGPGYIKKGDTVLINPKDFSISKRL